MKYYIIAGEPSGDLHASNLIKALKVEDSAADVRCWGGELSQAAGGHLVHHYKKLALMGFLEVATALPTILKALKFCKSDILEWKPDVVILVDFAGFNMRIAKFAKLKGFKVFYYISPKIWAWNSGRAHTIKKYVDKMFCIMPFEKEFYAKYGMQVDYVGNPVNDAVSAFRKNPDFRRANGLDDKPIVAVLPGSRRQEIENMLSFMVSIIPPYLNDYQFVIAAVPHYPSSYYEGFRRHECVKVVYNKTYDLLANAEAALVTSGTATLETTMFEVPQVVCYKGSTISYLIARALVNVKFISLPNLIAGKRVVTELIQDNFNPANLMVELDKILKDKSFRENQISEYQEIKALLGQPGASETTAKLMVKYLGLN